MLGNILVSCRTLASFVQTLEDSAEPKPGSRELLDSSELWVPQQGRHSVWLKTLCVALVDSGGVTSEVLLLSRPLCEVSGTATDMCGLQALRGRSLAFIHQMQK